MKKKTTWIKFKHWLIKKLGGHVFENSVPLIRDVYHSNVLTLESRVTVKQPSFRGFDNINNNNTEWFKDNFPRDVIHLKSALANAIVELDDGAITFDHGWDPITDEVVIRARIRIVEHRKEDYANGKTEENSK